MSAIDAKPFPKPALIGAALLIGINLIGVGAYRLTIAADQDVVRSASVSAEPLLVRELHFVLEADGQISVHDARDGRHLDTLRADDGFIKVVLQSMSFDRAKRQVTAAQTYRLTRWNNGKLSFEDPATGVRMNLAAFGADAMRVFARFLPNDEGAKG